MARILVTGASGYVGNLIAAALLASEADTLVLPVRPQHDPERLTQRVLAEARALVPDQDPAALRAQALARLQWTSWPDVAAIGDPDTVGGWGDIDEVVHAAGCLDYFNTDGLQHTNVEGTAHMVAFCRARGGLPLTWISSAFASGYREGQIPEALHAPEADDPTRYTESKRSGEQLVAESGLPWLILRPTVLIGDSRDGHYSGKTYGIYQLWNGIERLLLSRTHEHFDIAAPEVPVPLLHQDHWQEAFLRVRAAKLRKRIVHVASDPAQLPTKRALWHLWMEHCFRPTSVRYWPDMESLPVRTMDRRQRALMAMASVNVEIATRHWRFDTATLDELRVHPVATLESVWRCQRRYMDASDAIRAYHDSRSAFGDRPIQVDP